MALAWVRVDPPTLRPNRQQPKSIGSWWSRCAGAGGRAGGGGGRAGDQWHQGGEEAGQGCRRLG